MANEHGLFWNSQNGDRVYDANDFSEWLKKFYTTGVFNGDLEVTAAGGMTVSVSSGYVNIEGKVKFFSTPTTLTLATASGTYGRIDTVVAECNYTDREIKLKVVTGTYSVSPTATATAPVRTAAAYQLVLAQIDVAAGAAEITQKNITDKRMDSNVCGLVTGTVSQIDFSTVKAQFDSWFDGVKGTLDTDAAGNLKNQIDAINNKIGTTITSRISKNTAGISKNTADISALNSSLSDKCTINLGFYDCPGSNVKELMQNLATYATNHGVSAGRSGVITGGWGGKQYGTTIVTYTSYMINVTFVGTGGIIIGYVGPADMQCTSAWGTSLSPISIT